MTACGPEDAGTAADDPSPAASRGSSASAAPSIPPDGGQAGAKCPQLAAGHRFVYVTGVEGAMNNVIARTATLSCNDGVHLRPHGPERTFSFSPDAKMTVIEQHGPKLRTDKTGPHTGIAHVKQCADPNGTSYDGGQARPQQKEYCNGGNFYDVGLAGGTITEMTELPVIQ
ncbi:hypothetical protein AB0C96_38035 [Streptomyces sp. NPDC048506]|uniref:hypothetical protein n=1 Tax=Streptomyces sp. NPDC048506 TaxID=3155028 RepID=UPI00342BBA4B